jgi:hypothetical protein
MKKKIILVSFFAVLLLAIAGPVLAADSDTAYDPLVTQAILAGIGGIITVQGLTTYLMKLVKNATETMKRILGYLFSMASSAVVTAAYLAITKAFSVPALLMYGAAVWFVASGLYDTYHPAKKTG